VGIIGPRQRREGQEVLGERRDQQRRHVHVAHGSLGLGRSPLEASFDLDAALGANPSIAVICPTDAAALDLTQVGSDDLYLFSLRSTGDSSPLFGLRFVEAKNVPSGLDLPDRPGRARRVLYGHEPVPRGSLHADE
jgi:hypothetical protein